MKRIILFLLAVLTLTACGRKTEQACDPTCDPIYDRSDFVEVTEVIPDVILFSSAIVL